MQGWSSTFTLLGLAAVAYVFLTFIGRMIGHEVYQHQARHDLLRETKRRRLAYEKEVLDRQRSLVGGSHEPDVDILDTIGGDDEPATASGPAGGRAPAARRAA
jgi:hypothetical protein